MPAIAEDFLRDNGTATDDSGSDSDAAGDSEYYRPISTESDDEGGGESRDAPPSFAQSNGHHLDNGISDLDLNSDTGGGVGGEPEAEEEEEEEERARAREASISRAFSEDESRRSAPLTPENAARIVEAMRGVSFNGFAPDWVSGVAEDRWVDQLRRLRGETSSQS